MDTITRAQAVQAAIMLDQTGRSAKVASKAAKEQKTVLSAYLFDGMKGCVNVKERRTFIDEFRAECVATGQLPDGWAKSSSLATALSNARKVADGWKHCGTAESLSVALRLVKDASKAEESADEREMFEKKLERAPSISEDDSEENPRVVARDACLVAFRKWLESVPGPVREDVLTDVALIV